MERIDRKFNIEATCIEHQHTHTHDDAVLFLAKDKALPPTLIFYKKVCETLGAEPSQLEGLDRLIERVQRWQAENPGQLKVADVDPGFASIISGPNEV